MTNSTPYRRKEVIGDFSVTFVGDEQEVSIYAVSAAQGEPPVYVGSTAQILRHRIRAHVLDAKNGSVLPFHAWLRSVPAFTVEVLERVPASARIAAEQKWVAHFPNLLNVTDGGPGLAGHRFAGTDHARRIAAKIRTASLFTCEQCASSFHRKHSQALKGNSRFCSRACYQQWQRGKSKGAAA